MRFDLNININLPEPLLELFRAQTEGAKVQVAELKAMIASVSPQEQFEYEDDDLNNIPHDIGLIPPEELFKDDRCE